MHRIPPTRFTSVDSFEQVSQWMRDVQAWMREQPTVETLETRALGGDDMRLRQEGRRQPPLAVLLVRAEEVRDPGTLATPKANVVYEWRQLHGTTEGEIVVTSTSGLTAATLYDLRFMVIG